MASSYVGKIWSAKAQTALKMRVHCGNTYQGWRVGTTSQYWGHFAPQVLYPSYPIYHYVYMVCQWIIVAFRREITDEKMLRQSNANCSSQSLKLCDTNDHNQNSLNLFLYEQIDFNIWLQVLCEKSGVKRHKMLWKCECIVVHRIRVEECGQLPPS